nr:M48 family metallopeptidase [Gammaproteobacteria bacterium]
APLQLPTQIRLELTGQDIALTYQRQRKPRLEETGQGLIIFHQDQDQALDLLRQWLRQQARQQLLPRLHALAAELGFSFQRVTIRSQKSRWGSCSSRGTISLNDQLMFMPAASVRYLMIHELCHTRHLNHSPAFWQLVEQCCADYRAHEQILNRGRELVPGWFLQSLYR